MKRTIVGVIVGQGLLAATALAVPPREPVVFVCPDGTRVTAKFEPTDDYVTLTLPSGTVRLPHTTSGSGARYSNGTLTFWNKGDKAMIERGDKTLYSDCVAQGTGDSPAPGAASAPQASVTGTVTYRERIALPPDAELLIRLEDVSRADAPSEVIAEGSATIPHQVPISFELPYDSSAINPAHRYLVSVTILQGGKSLFVTDTAHHVLTRGAPTKVDIVLRRLNTDAPVKPAK